MKEKQRLFSKDLEVDKWHWTYCTTTTNKGNKLREDTLYAGPICRGGRVSKSECKRCTQDESIGWILH
jgi:hypothetical protein